MPGVFHEQDQRVEDFGRKGYIYAGTLKPPLGYVETEFAECVAGLDGLSQERSPSAARILSEKLQDFVKTPAARRCYFTLAIGLKGRGQHAEIKVEVAWNVVKHSTHLLCPNSFWVDQRRLGELWRRVTRISSDAPVDEYSCATC